MKKVLDIYRVYCQSFPAFSLCICSLLAIGCPLTKSFFLVLITLIYFTLEILTSNKARFLLVLKICFFIAMVCWSQHKVKFSNQEILPSKGSCSITINSAKKTFQYGKTSISYLVSVSNFKSNQKIKGPFLARLHIKNLKPLKLDKKYLLKQIYLKKDPGKIAQIKADKSAQLIPSETLNFPVAKYRYQLTSKIDRILSKNIRHKKVYHLFKALSLGYTDHQTIAFEFSRLGLQHLLAISGFHFALLSLSFSLLLRKIFPLNVTCIILIGLLTLYLIYLGNSPSVKRAYFAITIHLLGHLLSLKPKALNSLCLSCLILLCLNPLEVQSLGFLLSYSATFGILTLYKPILEYCQSWIQTRTIKEALSFSTPDKIVYITLIALKSSSAINLAVSLTTVPIILCQIGSFPPFSLLYNMIIPFGVSISMILLIFSFCLSWIPALASILYSLNEWITRAYLVLISNPPYMFTKSFYCQIPKEFAVVIFIITLGFAMTYHYRKSPLLLEGSAKTLLT